MAWDIRSMDSITQMIIVTDYHSNGSLYDHLQTHTLTEEETVRLVLSSVAGLCHLHLEVEGKPYKPGIAHRDLKSKNILVKSNGETCIADFGLAVCSTSGEKGVDVIPNIKAGTRRYMAPEVLDDSMKVQWFEAYKQADMYSFALILWEIGRSTVI
jgi:serine/threonine protein kinase